jgi:uncharacterized protein YijF (DUF1287 family)
MEKIFIVFVNGDKMRVACTLQEFLTAKECKRSITTNGFTFDPAYVMYAYIDSDHQASRGFCFEGTESLVVIESSNKYGLDPTSLLSTF